MNFTDQIQNCPSSFCTICTNKCKNELVLLLLTLSIHHNGAKVYIMCDKESKLAIDELTPNLNKQLKMKWFVELDKYSNKSRNDMVKEEIWSEFQMMKANVMKKTLNKEKDTKATTNITKAD